MKCYAAASPLSSPLLNVSNQISLTQAVSLFQPFLSLRLFFCIQFLNECEAHFRFAVHSEYAQHRFDSLIFQCAVYNNRNYCNFESLTGIECDAITFSMFHQLHYHQTFSLKQFVWKIFLQVICSSRRIFIRRNERTCAVAVSADTNHICIATEMALIARSIRIIFDVWLCQYSPCEPSLSFVTLYKKNIAACDWMRTPFASTETIFRIEHKWWMDRMEQAQTINKTKKPLTPEEELRKYRIRGTCIWPELVSACQLQFRFHFACSGCLFGIHRWRWSYGWIHSHTDVSPKTGWKTIRKGHPRNGKSTRSGT